MYMKITNTFLFWLFLPLKWNLFIECASRHQASCHQALVSRVARCSHKPQSQTCTDSDSLEPTPHDSGLHRAQLAEPLGWAAWVGMNRRPHIPHVPYVTSHLHWGLRTCSNPYPAPSEPSLQLSHIPIAPAQSRVTTHCLEATEEPDARSDTMGKWQPRAKFSMIRSTTLVGLFFPTNLNDFHQVLIRFTTLRWTWLCQSWLSSANRFKLRSGN